MFSDVKDAFLSCPADEFVSTSVHPLAHRFRAFGSGDMESRLLRYTWSLLQAEDMKTQAMENVATVTCLDGAYAVVEVVPVVSGCGRCHEAGGCGSGLLNKSLRPPRLDTYRLPNLVGAVVGDRVILSIPEGAVLRAALLAYLLPVVLLIVGAAIGTALSDVELTPLIGASAGLVLGLFILRVTQSRLAGGKGVGMEMRLEKSSKDLA